uniref:Uncharacterized protein n=1 Tax=Globodera rostochiensis TaxID=31243 RepID=A0A914HW47_GLORO
MGRRDTGGAGPRNDGTDDTFAGGSFMLNLFQVPNKVAVVKWVIVESLLDHHHQNAKDKLSPLSLGESKFFDGSERKNDNDDEDDDDDGG